MSNTASNREQSPWPHGKGERLYLFLNNDEIRAVEDFRYAARKPTRADALRELLHLGLERAEGEIHSHPRSEPSGPGR